MLRSPPGLWEGAPLPNLITRSVCSASACFDIDIDYGAAPLRTDLFANNDRLIVMRKARLMGVLICLGI